ncbi:MAG: hypothetical protein ACK5II_06480 [Paracoccus sp. (in: a-proteobacteria)]
MNGMSGIGGDLLGTLAVGVGAAALIYAVMHALRRGGRALPKWLLPSGIGLSMIAFATWNEYSWANRVKAQLPERIMVVAEGKISSAIRPWTYILPPTTRMALIDPEAVREVVRNERIVPVILVERWKRSVTVEQGVDCENGRIRPPKGEWQDAGISDPAFAAICVGG